MQNLYLIRNRWKFRRAIPERLRPHIDGQITEFVRWLGSHEGQGKSPLPNITARYSKVASECAALIVMAEKRATGHFDALNAETIAHLIGKARHDLMHEDDEARFDSADEEVHAAVHGQLSALGGSSNGPPRPDRRWENRQGDLEASLEMNRHAYSRGRIDDFIRDEVVDRCAGFGLRVDTASDGFRNLARAYLALSIEVAEKALQRQTGEILPTPAPPPPIAAHAVRKPAKQTITGLATDWWKEAERTGRSRSTMEAYTRAAQQLSDFLGHDDANAVGNIDIVRFKDFRIEQGKTSKTVKNGDLSALKVLFTWGVANHRVAVHPGTVSLSVGKRKRTRPPGFTDAEAVSILAAAANYEPDGREPSQITKGKRWVPWLLAYTGARLGEMAQLRKEDVRHEDGRWIMRLTPEAGTIKTGDYRDVVMHPHLVQAGFPEFVRKAPAGHLFLKITREGPAGVRGALRTTKNRVTVFVRGVVTDPNVQPNHAWRHRFETTTSRLQKRMDTTNAITGHSKKNSAADYGDNGPDVQEAFFADWPWFDVEMKRNKEAPASTP
ncbi:hypothetical protein ASD83_15550 [Devosia sp. Root685]|uniref:site-specific integrase n=1 Tax=Devosia sp. Root685 TaxID=1736587 RepID=UPI0006FDFEEA|nr:site-specific integrase [Devosia sp. Root685]KRA96519.1 hypothetical protein ASD83_15550 [Devosia sp. Root685]